MSWNYRIVKRIIQSAPRVWVSYGIHEVYYHEDEKKNIRAISEDPHMMGGWDDLEDLVSTLPLLTRALERPVVCYETLEEIKDEKEN